MNTAEAKTLTSLTQAECEALLATQEVGRLVYTRRALPAITPVNFVLRDGAIWIWTASTSSMWQAVRGAVVAFEADDLDRVAQSGWSVVVLGVAELVRDARKIERALTDGPEPWVMGRKEHLLRVPLTAVSGRRIHPANAAPDGGAFASLSDDSPLAETPQ
jgi:nitroimidazol reductase NimA-like FMN-containing flavoprotein (pyridoxamine 5'-phosphate oxidase superfamily)